MADDVHFHLYGLFWPSSPPLASPIWPIAPLVRPILTVIFSAPATNVYYFTVPKAKSTVQTAP